MHRAELMDSAIHPGIIALNFRTIEDSPPTAHTDPEFPIVEFLGWRAPDKKTPYRRGWACQGLDPSKDWKPMEWGCLKLDTEHQRENHQKPGKRIKYEHPSGQPTRAFFLDVPAEVAALVAERAGLEPPAGAFWPWVLASRLPIVITEGAKKAAALLSIGLPAVALPGIWGGCRKGDRNVAASLREDTARLADAGCPILFCFDNDVKERTIQDVKNAIRKTSALIVERGGRAGKLGFPGPHKGIDDYLAADVTHADALIAAYHEAIAALDTPQEVEESGKRTRPSRAEIIADIRQFYQGRVRRNLLGETVELDGKEWGGMDRAYLDLATEQGIEAAKEFVIDVLAGLADENAYSPVEQYLKNVYALHQDKTVHLLDDLAFRYFGTDDPLHNTYLRRWLVGAVARVRRPGCKFDLTLILKGRQGVGKSSFFRILGGTWFSDSMAQIDNKDDLMVMHRAWINEWAELENVTGRRDISEVKSFLTRQEDAYRRPYARDTVPHPRRSVIVGTTNRDEFLADETGDRRFMVVPVHQQIDFAQLGAERDAIWAAAVDLFLKGEPYYLTAAETALQARANETYAVSDSWEEKILPYLAHRTEVTTSEILERALGIEAGRHTNPDQKRVGIILRRRGWESVRTKARRYWRPPGEGDGVTGENAGPVTLPSPPEIQSTQVFQPAGDGVTGETTKTLPERSKSYENQGLHKSFDSPVLLKNSPVTSRHPSPEKRVTGLPDAPSPEPEMPARTTDQADPPVSLSEGDRVTLTDLASLPRTHAHLTVGVLGTVAKDCPALMALVGIRFDGEQDVARVKRTSLALVSPDSQPTDDDF
ncbi:VapE domain-containing protein [Gloeobacter violaceus]|uniref:VapE domain-containing protein n=1 Tax=Gloeobacter violaceus TaxID=33072 RepID=UPI0013E8ACB5|nr:VapE domain-containing protein [Gloeobacter violaceus]